LIWRETLPGVSKTCIGLLVPVAVVAAADARSDARLAGAADTIARVDERRIVEWK
jgi:hypothetical protein